MSEDESIKLELAGENLCCLNKFFYSLVRAVKKGNIMLDFMKHLTFQIISFIVLIAIFILMFSESAEEESTRATMNKWAEKLDRNVKLSGVYIQWESDTLPESDEWGTPLKVTYKNEGVAERLFVTSAGEDKSWNTSDDLKASRMQINAKGIGEGIKEHTAQTAKEFTKGVSEGIKEEISQTVAGVKVGVKESIKETASSVKEKASDLASDAKEKTLGLMAGIKDKLSKDEDENP